MPLASSLRRDRRAGHAGKDQEPGRSGRLLLAGRGTGDQSPGRESKPKEGTAERGRPSGKHGLGRGGTGVQKSERFVVPMKRGNQPTGPRGGKGAPNHRAIRGKDERDTGLDEHLNETGTDSNAGAGASWDGVDNTRPPHRHRLVARGVPPHAKKTGPRASTGRALPSTRRTWRATSSRCSNARSREFCP